jgi:hypothetical protein
MYNVKEIKWMIHRKYIEVPGDYVPISYFSVAWRNAYKVWLVSLSCKVTHYDNTITIYESDSLEVRKISLLRDTVRTQYYSIEKMLY